ncbi:MAG: hypothetical protein NXY57DRAFT_15391 [Lentinula lateritia]|nr:MAG: hypothetical protein NXY57DRAFT_15391 [Lentinula lateritia]
MDENEQTKRKKPPACDYCKARRVICHAQSEGPCPRCVEKGVPCTTTALAARRRRRTKAEMQEERLKKANKTADSTLRTAELETSQPNEGPTRHIEAPHFIPPSLSLSAELVAELIQIFHILPQSLHPIIPLDELEASLRLASWSLSSLPPQLRVLAQCIVTLASFFSTNAAIVGRGGCGPEVTSIALSKAPLKEPVVPDLREYGVRRKPVCYQLWTEALSLAHQQGITAHVSRENAACCWLLDFLECRFSGEGVSTYASAYNSHLRCLAETNDSAIPGDAEAASPGTSVLYRAYMMHDAVYAITSRRSIPFSHQDELLISGPCTTTLEQLLQEFSSDVSNKQLFLSMNAFASHTIRLARESSERLSGVYARRRTLDEVFLASHFASLDLMHSILLAERDRALWVVDNSTESHFIRSCAYALHISWGCLVLNLYDLLLDRVNNNLCDFDLGFTVHSAVPSATEYDPREWARLHFSRVRQMALRVAVGISEALKDVPCISRVTHLHFEELEKWAKLLLGESGTVVINRSDRSRALQCYRDALKIAGFSWANRSAGLVEIIDEHLAES